MSSRRNQTITCPWPEAISPRVWGLLFRWAEWRSIAGYPRSPRIPDPTSVWEIKHGCAVPVREGFCLIPSTQPRPVSDLDEFGAAFNGLADLDRHCLLALVWYQAQPWLKGEWKAWMDFMGLTSRLRCARLLKSACERLQAAASKRGLA